METGALLRKSTGNSLRKVSVIIQTRKAVFCLFVWKSEGQILENRGKSCYSMS